MNDRMSLLFAANTRMYGGMKKSKRDKKLLVALTAKEMVDLEVITSLEGYSSKSETVRQLIHKRKQAMYRSDQGQYFEQALEES
jgi:hypothetical protein